MKMFSKRFLILMMQMMISTTLIVSPIAHAKKDPPKTQFDDRDMDAKHEDSELTNKDLQTLERNMKRDDDKFGVDYVAMLVGMLFAMTALTGPLPKRYDHAKSDCPMDISGQITIPLMKIAGLTFIIGEIYNLIKFSKIKGKVKEMDGQMNYNKTVKAESMEEDSEYKSQIETYDKLNAIYWEQWKSFRTKKDIYTAVLVATRTAEVIDGGMGIACMGVCTAKTTMLKTRAEANLKAIETDIPILQSAFAGCPISAAAACSTYAATSLARAEAIRGSMLKTDGMSAKKLAEASKAYAKWVQDTAKMFSELLGMNVVSAAVAPVQQSMFKFEQKAVMRDKAEAAKNYTELTTDQATTQASLETTEAQVQICLAAMVGELSTYTTACKVPTTAAVNCPLETNCTQGIARTKGQIAARAGISAGIKGGFEAADKAVKAIEDGTEELSEAFNNIPAPSIGGVSDEIASTAQDTAAKATEEAEAAMEDASALIESSATLEPYQRDLEETLDKKLTCCGSRGVGQESTWENPTLRVAVPKPPGMAMLRRDVKPKEEGEGLMEKVKGFFKNIMGKIGDTGTIHKDFLPYFESEEKLLEVAFSNIMYQKAFKKYNQSFSLPLGPMMKQLAFSNLSHELNTNTELSFLQLRQVAFNDYHGQYIAAIKNNNSSKSKLLEMSMVALSNIGISNAHAKKGNAGAAAGGIIGGILALVLLGGTSGAIGSFVKKLGNVVEKIYSMMTRSMLTRTLFWAIYDALISTLISNSKKEMKLIEEQMETIDKLKEQVAGTADEATAVDGTATSVVEATGQDYEARFNAETKQESYSKVGSDKLAREDCISVGNTASMGACPGEVKSNKFKIKEMNKLKRQSPMGFEGSKMSMDTASGVSGAGASGMNSYLAANMDKMKSFNSAISKQLTKQRAKIKKINSRNDHKLSRGTLDAKKKSNSALQNFVNNLKSGNLKGAISGAAATSSGPSAMDEMSGNTTRKSGKVASYSPRPSVKPYVPKFPKKGKRNSYKTNYGNDDDDDDDYDSESSMSSSKAQQNLSDYDYDSNENDVEKRTDVSLFKLLSNRYLLSYPRVLNVMKVNKKEKAKPRETDKSRKEDEIEDILDN